MIQKVLNALFKKYIQNLFRNSLDYFIKQLFAFMYYICFKYSA